MFKNLKLGVKLSLGFGVVLVLTAAVAIIGVISLSSVEKEVTSADDVNRIIKYMLDIRQQEKNYIIRHDAEYVEKVGEGVQNIIDLAGTVKAEVSDLKLKTDVDKVIKSANQYLGIFNHYVNLDQDSAQAIETWRGLTVEIYALGQDVRKDVIFPGKKGCRRFG